MPELKKLLSESIKPLRMTTEDEENFQASTTCCICSKPLTAFIAVKDHDHLTGKYRGAAHRTCNFEREVPKTVPVLFHNFKNFDSHLLLKEIKSGYFEKIKVIPQTIEKFLAIFLDDYTFLDFFAYLTSSLDKLGESVSQMIKTHFLLQCFKPEDLPLVSQKGAIPFDYLDSIEKFQETELPPKHKFYNVLKQSFISDEVYDRLKQMWTHFNCKTMQDFCDIYLKIDVLLLAAIFEEFRDMSFAEFDLDPAHFFSVPGLTWCAAMKHTKATLELLTEPDHLLFVEKGIRGGITCVMERYAEANNPEMSSYDQTKNTSYIAYLDVNNLYGFALRQSLPYRRFKWVDESLFDDTIKQIMEAPDNDTVGYILEVDLDYPSSLHDHHNDYPLAPEKRMVTPSELGLYQCQLSAILAESGVKTLSTTKLVPNLYDKKRYILHARNLRFYVEKGLVLKQVYRILSFEQGPWLAPYIDLCTSKRQASVTPFQKDFWKLMVNALYGKSIEDKRKHCKVEIVQKDVRAEKLIRKNHMMEFMILGDDIAAFKMKNKRVYMNKPIYLGFSVLEISKLHMFSLHYDTFKPFYGDNIKLLYTDTDSFIYHIRTQSLNDDLKRLGHIMDFSDYPEDHPLHDKENKKKLGYLKDEMNGSRITKFIALKSKMYCLLTENSVSMRAKGVSRTVLNHEISFNAYCESLFENKYFKHEMKRLCSKDHGIKAIRQTKISLSPLYDKRYILDDKISSFAHGHYRIQL